MDPSQLERFLDAQRQLLQTAKQRKGQRATNKPSREQLLFQFSQMGNASGYKYNVKTCQINYAYPPSTTPLADLKPITIAEFRLETNHVGRVLLVRTITDPMRIQSVQNLVEDKDSEVDQLAVYNIDPKAAPLHILPKNTVFAIKEPYYKTSASGGFLVRVDHPSDIVRLPATHPMVPIELIPRLLELNQDAFSYKSVGNAAFKDKKYLPALEAYTEGLGACGHTDDSLRRDLYRNRSIVNTYLHRYETAYADAIAAFIPDIDSDETAKNNNVKALYRAGRAAYCAEKFSEAKAQFEQLLRISPDDKDGLEQLAKTNARLQENTTGNYDFAAMSSLADAGHKRFDRASFTNNVVIRTANEKGRGLFATKDIKAGELVMVEKAFSVAFKSELGNETYLILNLNTNTARIGSHAIMFYQLVQKMLHNPTQAKLVLDLFDGGYSPKCTAETVDGNVVIDTFQVAAIMERNCFGCPDKSTADEIGKKKSEDRESESVGVWVMASYFNHACDSNAHRVFIGDIMTVRATKDIEKDQEISIAYRAPEFDNDKTQEALQKMWKFRCDCNICTAESKTPTPQRRAQRALLNEIAAFLDKYPKTTDYASNKSIIAQAENLYAQLDATYNAKLFANIPRIALAHLGVWICGVYQTDKTMHKVIDIANRVLQGLGFRVVVDGKKLLIDCSHGYTQVVAADAAMYAAHTCYYLRKVALGKQYEAFAKERYRIFCGEMKGFVERYGDSSEM